MTKPFYSRNHGCLECGGMVEWSAAYCPYCERRVTLADRCHWAFNTAAPLLTVFAFAIGSLLGLAILKFPMPILSMLIAVAIGFWSVLRTSSFERECVPVRSSSMR